MQKYNLLSEVRKKKYRNYDDYLSSLSQSAEQNGRKFLSYTQNRMYLSYKVAHL